MEFLKTYPKKVRDGQIKYLVSPQQQKMLNKTKQNKNALLHSVLMHFNPKNASDVTQALPTFTPQGVSAQKVSRAPAMESIHCVGSSHSDSTDYLLISFSHKSAPYSSVKKA